MLPNLFVSLVESFDAIDVGFTSAESFIDNGVSELVETVSPEAESLLQTGIDFLLDTANELIAETDGLDGIISTPIDIDLTPDEDFFDNTLSDLLAAISPEFESLLQTGVDSLLETTGEIVIEAGVLEGIISTLEEGNVPIAFDVPAALAEFGELLVDASGSLSLAEGILNATLELDDDQYEVVDFDLATFAADGLSFLLSEADVTLPIVNGALLVSEETPLGEVTGAITFGDGALDVDIETPAGTLDLVVPFSPDAQFPFEITTPFGIAEANVDFFDGNITIPILLGVDIDIPLSSLNGEIELDDGIASLTIDTLLGPITEDFEIDTLVNDTVVDFLTGVTLDAQLLAGQLDIVATSGDEAIATAFDLIDLNNQAIEFLSETNGNLSLDEGLLNGFISVGGETIDIEQSVEDLLDLLAVPLNELLALTPSTV